MESICEFDKHHTHIRRHSQEHFAEVFNVSIHSSIFDLSKLGNSANHGGNIRAKFLLDIFKRALGVFWNIVEQGGGKNGFIQVHFRKGVCGG